MTKLLVDLEISRFFLKRSVNALTQWFHAKRAASDTRFLHRLWADQTGAVALMFIASGVLTFGASLGAIDLIRYTDAKSRVQASLDNAALAAGQLALSQGTSNLAALQDEAQAYFDSNFPTGYLGSTITGNKLSVQLGAGTLKVTFNSNLPLVSTGFLKVSSLGLASYSEVELASISDVEVVFAVDSGDHGAHTTLNSFAVNLAQALMLESDPSGAPSSPREGVNVGVVPFSSVVNVGGEANAKHWVARWQDVWRNDATVPARKKERLESTNPDYVDIVWGGCIAEPRPWLAPSVNSVSARTPGALFQPVFIRFNTPVAAKKNSGNGAGQLDDNISETYSYEDLILLERNTSVSKSYDRRLWAEFGGDMAGNPKNDKPDKTPAFEVYGAYEPRTCVSQLRTRFLSNNFSGAVKPTLEGLSGIADTNRGKTLLPAGLLWSWRMLHPSWREGKGWQGGGALPSGVERKVIVLFSGGHNTSWDNLIETDKKAPKPWNTAAGVNQFAFKFDYKAKGLKTFVQSPFELDVKNNADFWLQDVYQPGTSVAMSDPYADGQSPQKSLTFTGWPSVSDYAVGVCDAIKNDGIKIYVVDVNGTAEGATASAAKTALLACSSENRVYSATSQSEVNTLRDRILQDVSGSQRLRLIR